jgi:hypothetical protein
MTKNQEKHKISSFETDRIREIMICRSGERKHVQAVKKTDKKNYRLFHGEAYHEI